MTRVRGHAPEEICSGNIYHDDDSVNVGGENLEDSDAETAGVKLRFLNFEVK